MDLYDQDASEQLRERFRELEEAGELNDFNDIYSPDEMPVEELAEELEGAELVFEKEWEKKVKKIDDAIKNKMMETGAMGTEPVTVRIKLTEEEKKLFIDSEKYDSDHYFWEFEGKELVISYTEEVEG